MNLKAFMVQGMFLKDIFTGIIQNAGIMELEEEVFENFGIVNLQVILFSHQLLSRIFQGKTFFRKI